MKLNKLSKELLEEWDYEQNNLNPETLTLGSNRKVWWKCKKDNHHRWMAIIYSRYAGNGCPTCAGKQICPQDACNSIGRVKNDDGSLKYGELLKEWGQIITHPLYGYR